MDEEYEMPKHAVERVERRHPLNMKTTAEMRAKMQEAAASSGRTLIAEVEHRLEQSFLFDEVISRLVSRIKEDTIQFLADSVDGEDNLSTGLRIAQRLSFFDLPEQMDEAAADIAAVLPRLMAKRPLKFGGRLSRLGDEAMFDAAFAGPAPNETDARRAQRETERAEAQRALDSGEIRFATEEELKAARPVDTEAKLFRSVIEEVKSEVLTEQIGPLGHNTRQTYKKKS